MDVDKGTHLDSQVLQEVVARQGVKWETVISRVMTVRMGLEKHYTDISPDRKCNSKLKEAILLKKTNKTSYHERSMSQMANRCKGL